MFSWIGGLFTSAWTAVTGFSIGTWIQIGVFVAMLATVGGLYYWGHEESLKNVAAAKQIGAENQIIADDKANMATDVKTITDWQNKLAAYEVQVVQEQQYYQDLNADKEKVDAQLAEIQAEITSNPMDATAAINVLNDSLVCLLNGVGSASRAIDGCAAAAPGPSGSTPAGTP